METKPALHSQTLPINKEVPFLCTRSASTSGQQRALLHYGIHTPRVHRTPALHPPVSNSLDTGSWTSHTWGSKSPQSVAIWIPQRLWKCTRKPQQQLLSLFSCLINKNPLPLISWHNNHWLQLCRGNEARLVLLTPPTVFNSCVFYIVQLFEPHHLRQNPTQTHVEDVRFNVKYSGVKELRSDYSF